MNCTTSYLPYARTGYFSTIITDYLSANDKLTSLYAHPGSIEGIKAAIADRKQFKTDRGLLVRELQKQYGREAGSEKVNANIESLLSENTFTVCTAHQPNIFTGHLYLIYKILHAVKLAGELTAQLPGYHFVPVFYMGSEDADLEELGHFYINGEKHVWKTGQTGAVGRMKVDKALIALIDDISGQLLTYPHGSTGIDLLRSCYTLDTSIEQATFKLLHALFSDYGLIVLLPDNVELKRAFVPVIERELAEGFSAKAVKETVAHFPTEYKVQAGGRELNLFYLAGNTRERIVYEDPVFKIQHSTVSFSKMEIHKEVNEHPERFSPNVILRPVFQEMILPNIAFIGGGGEIAYWLELKKVFECVQVPFPVLVLRNSFLFVNREVNKLRKKLNLGIQDLFKKETELIDELVKKETSVQLSLEKEKQALTRVYGDIQNISGGVDITLAAHTHTLLGMALKKIDALEKKMLKAERKKFEAEQRQLHKLHKQLFPHGSLQERIENIFPFQARYGPGFIKILFESSLGLGQEFCILEES